MPKRKVSDANNPTWYKDAIIYELHIKSFNDSTGSGKGDIQGVIEKLDYLQDLGVTAVWLLPFFPSPLRDDGYDIQDYMNVNPEYGTIQDFKKLIREAHKRDLRIIIELVLNHTSDQHEWFKRARKAPAGSAHRDFYVWSDTQDKYRDARIIFKDFEPSNWSWDPEAKAYYWHRFYHHQPDLNYENPQVHKALFKVFDFWFKMGVDGVRLDAVPYLYEEEGTNCENLPRTFEFLKKLRARLDERYKDRMLLAEANQWPEDAAEYFGDGDACHMSFHFPLMPRMFMALEMEDRYPILDILEQTPSIPETAQWAIFLRNHDELTLEMVTDEERDYMYRMYARDPKSRINLGIRRRLAPLLGNDRRKIELMNVLLFSMPGTPVLYYGDEIAMGDNYYLGDRDGVRTPMQWSADRNAGFSRSNPQSLYLPVIIDPEYHYEAINVETAQSNRSSLFWWMKGMIAMRKMYPAFARGDVSFLMPDNHKVLAFIRSYKDEHILIVCNLSRFPQAASLVLSGFEGCEPIELMSHTRFPMVRTAAYDLTLNPHGYYMFKLHRNIAEEVARSEVVPVVTSSTTVNMFDADFRSGVESVLPSYFIRRNRLLSSTAILREINILEALPFGRETQQCWLLVVAVRYMQQPTELYSLFVSRVEGEAATDIATARRPELICTIEGDSKPAVLIEGFVEGWSCESFINLYKQVKSISGRHGVFTVLQDRRRLPMLRPCFGWWKENPESSAVICGNDLFFRMYRRLSDGINPDAEMMEHLSVRCGYPNVPQYFGALKYICSKGDEHYVGSFTEYIHCESDVRQMVVDSVTRFYEGRLASDKAIEKAPEEFDADIFEIAFERLDLNSTEVLTEADVTFFTLLGKRLGEMHLALSRRGARKDFAPEPYSKLYARSVYQSVQSVMKRTMDKLHQNRGKLHSSVIPYVDMVLGRRKQLLKNAKQFLDYQYDCHKIRVHGNLYLRRIFYTGKDFLFVNFEGYKYRSFTARRLKDSGLRDIVDLLDSLQITALRVLRHSSFIRHEDKDMLEIWAEVWRRNAGGVLLRSYADTVEGSDLLPKDPEAFRCMLDVFCIQKKFIDLRHFEAMDNAELEVVLRSILNIHCPQSASVCER
ncbi:maltose alpha-D-glucosyltransferase [Halodesulfovibrio marinisediminis]|uniref:maltose alpha-D-glucosyltransferase n=1 Tax=Halodesulfovibrio marinisediminis DSM 17456 TaxID=1121457 RepID=A0A1N6IE74_9BACT|nr:maltose alpha-D-glucosyltransferase [Halodesulfovibrio marinisediminis]SIO30235.1 maltose alpha-D-glucosyltransferase/ alpha-amylase [Halodesulfovibrio marinisediminis DSM 17456]